MAGRGGARRDSRHRGCSSSSSQLPSLGGAASTIPSLILFPRKIRRVDARPLPASGSGLCYTLQTNSPPVAKSHLDAFWHSLIGSCCIHTTTHTPVTSRAESRQCRVDGIGTVRYPPSPSTRQGQHDVWPGPDLSVARIWFFLKFRARRAVLYRSGSRAVRRVVPARKINIDSCM